MKLAGLRQRDGVTCGPTVAVVAGALLDPAYRAVLDEPHFHAEQGRVHRLVNRIWPRRLGTTPAGVARAINAHSPVRYRWRVFRGLLSGGRDDLADVLAAVRSGRPVAVLVGRFIPRHWVLVVDAGEGRLYCYEPSSGQVRAVAIDTVRRGGLTGLGFPTPFAFVLPNPEGTRRTHCVC
ncbi:hypothetical protein C1S82_07445 [Mycolicibacterium cosmeticum]|uniref:Peptidase C39-like domain-containing protein n=1 Tax=Mycolicibacterium cosmeticum TaxID=258533 RepID=W9AQY9_MYCCO|nr:hypothetical protein [Mycolicibacterium cosmeticum]TLH80657.1 hypothetical protein C1S82_07445 [Mycolicibacterium cosmeticum]CDO07913.1 hypothetical protein BN977_02729 [Mycolicibacterium cosmeticum]